MMEAARTSETSVDNYFTRQYIPEDKSELHSRRREKLKSHIKGCSEINVHFPHKMRNFMRSSASNSDMQSAEIMNINEQTLGTLVKRAVMSSYKHNLATSAWAYRNGNSELPVYFLKATHEYTVGKWERMNGYIRQHIDTCRYDIQEQKEVPVHQHTSAHFEQ
jgi:hypothetical protein